MTEHKLKIAKTARFYTFGNPETAENLWIVLHGYSQLAQFFIRKFQDLDGDRNFVVAPEGFHRFYRDGTTGRVGASWMTKEARTDDISDNIQYLNQLSAHLLENKNYKRKILLGFSQGGATASRWHHLGNFKADIFILWGCVFAEDLSLENDTVGMFKSKNYFVVGKNDPFFEGKIEKSVRFFERQKFPTSIKIYDGNHDIHRATLLEIENEWQEAKTELKTEL